MKSCKLRILVQSIAIVGLIASPGLLVGQSPPSSTARQYGGKIEWTYHLRGPFGFSNETAVAWVTAGQVFCEGAIQTESGSNDMTGPGIFSLFFDVPDTTGRPLVGPGLSRRTEPVYNFNITCPRDDKPAHTANAMSSYDQPGGYVGLVNGQMQLPDTLRGTWSLPAPETDALNGVSGTVTMTWMLCNGCTPPPRPPVNPPRP